MDSRLLVDPLLLELTRCEDKLTAWLHSSEANAQHFARDPAGALRAANLGLDDHTLDEFAQVIQSISEKLGVAV